MTTTTAATDFKPCPFCGSTNLTINQWSIDDGEIDAVECLDCYGSAPANTWNQRSPMAEVAEIMEKLKK